MNKRNIFLILSLLVFILSSLFVFSQSPAPQKEPKQIKIVFPKGSLHCDPSRGSVALHAKSTHPETFIIEGWNEWEVLISSAGLYHLKQKSWGSIFWKVDVIKRQVTKITEGAGLTRKPDQPMGFEVEILTPGETAFAINFRKMELKIEPKKSQAKLYGDGSLLSNCEDLNQCKINPLLYHFMSRMHPGESFWKLDLGSKQWIYTSGGSFCVLSEEEKDLVWSDVQVEFK